MVLSTIDVELELPILLVAPLVVFYAAQTILVPSWGPINSCPLSPSFLFDAQRATRENPYESRECFDSSEDALLRDDGEKVVLREKA